MADHAVFDVTAVCLHTSSIANLILSDPIRHPGDLDSFPLEGSALRKRHFVLAPDAGAFLLLFEAGALGLDF
jgi:hypothetical protein